MKTIFLTGLLGLLLQQKTMAQGCSDAGFCTLTYRDGKTTKNAKQPRNTFTVEGSYNIGEKETTVFGLSLQYDRRFSHAVSWHNKITAFGIRGAFGNVLNAGDLYSTITYIPGEQKNNTLSLLAGVKIPFTGSNDKINGVPLPMVYQSSLGTYDIIAGASVLLSKWVLDGALQLPVINNNKNSFLSVYAPVPGFLSTNLFRRRADVLLRLGRPFTLASGKWSFNPNLLGIYHLGNDSYENIYGKRETINGSDGFTLNANLQAKRLLPKNRFLQFSAATPLVVRDDRPDGLTRSLVVSVAYGFGW